MANLEQLARMFVEPDGSFLWSGQDPASGGHWQLEGTVYDDGQVVRYIELRGQCPLVQWHEFVAAFEESLASIRLELLEQKRIVDGCWLAHGDNGES
jgi:hypothetical protein